MNVLLVEDNEDTASALGLLFELEGIGMRWTRTGEETLHLFSNAGPDGAAPPDVLMLDLTLPDMAGVALVQQLAKISALPPIVLYSASSNAELHRAAGELGAAAVLRKPCDARQIVETALRVAASVEPDTLPA